MLRILWFVIVVAALVAVSVWFAERPGDVTLFWQGWRVDTTVPVLLVGLLAFLAAVGIVMQLLVWLVGIPSRISRSRRESRRRKGYLALVDGLAAIASGDAGQARKKAERADTLLRDPPLTMLLSAQAAQLSGDGDQARRHFSAMLDRPETAFLGYRGLLTQALKDGDQAAALDYARRAHALNPEASWLTATLFDLQARAGLWRDALDTLTVAQKHGAFTAEEARRKRAIVLHERAGQLIEAGERGEATKQLRKAREADPAFSQASIRLATLLAEDGKLRKAVSALEDAWRAEPRPDVAAAYFGLFTADDPLQKVRRAETLAALAPNSVESHLVLAETALAAQLWGQARNHLATAISLRPTARAYRLLATVEEGENGDAAAAREALAKAAEAPPEPVWLCRQCGGAAPSWTATCPSCGGFDSISWADPVRPVVPTAQPVALPSVQPAA